MAFPGQVFAASNIPIRVPTHFMGREDSLAQSTPRSPITRAGLRSFVSAHNDGIHGAQVYDASLAQGTSSPIMAAAAH
jgi:hypothetical protein